MEKDKEKEMNLNTMYKHRELLDKTRVSICISLDRYILTLSSGALYLSIFFMNSLEGPIVMEKLLFFGWKLLIISIASMLLSMRYGIKAYERAIEETDEKLKDIITDRGSRKSCNCIKKVVSFFGLLGGVSFISGILFLVYFYLSNVRVL